MNSPATPVTIRVFDKEYVVSCPPHERDSLVESARILDRRMREARDSGKIIGTERMAVMAALNIVHDLLHSRAEQADFQTGLANEMRRLGDKIQQAIGRRSGDEQVD